MTMYQSISGCLSIHLWCILRMTCLQESQVNLLVNHCGLFKHHSSWNGRIPVIACITWTYTKVGEPHDAIQGYLLLNWKCIHRNQAAINREICSHCSPHTFIQDKSWFFDILTECRVLMKSLGGLSPDSIDENKRITRKLPIDIANRWTRVVDTRIYEYGSQFSCFDEFVDFLIPEIC